MCKAGDLDGVAVDVVEFVHPALGPDAQVLPGLAAAVDILVVVEGDHEVVGLFVQEAYCCFEHLVAEVLPLVDQDGVVLDVASRGFVQGQLHDRVVVGLILFLVLDLFVQDLRAELEEVHHLDAALAQGDLLVGKKPLDVVDEGDVVADKEDFFDLRVVLLEKGRAVDENEGLAAAGGARDDSVAALDLAGQGLLVVVEDLEAAPVLFALLFGAPVGQLEAHNGEEHALEALEFPVCDVEAELGHEHPLEGLEEAAARGVGPVVRLGVQVVAEEDLVGVDDLVEVLLLVLVLVDVGEDDAAVHRDLHLALEAGVGGEKDAVLLEAVHDIGEVLACLTEGVAALLGLAAHVQNEVLGVGLADLLQGPVLDLEDDEAHLVGEEKEVGLFALDVGEVPGEIAAVGPGDPLEEAVELPLAVGCELIHVAGDHGGHGCRSPSLFNRRLRCNGSRRSEGPGERPPHPCPLPRETVS